MDIARLRAETPGTENGIYLNTGSCSLMPRPVIDAVRDCFTAEAEIGGFRAASAQKDRLDGVYDAIARLIGAQPSEIALMGSNTLAWGSVFTGMQFAPGDRILTSRSEYAANYVAFLQMRKRTGCEIEVIASGNTGATSPAALEQMIDDRVKLIAVNWIPTNGGLMNPAAELGQVARKHGVPYLLDACQAVGQVPVDVNEIGCDYLTCAGRKWLRGPKGTGFLYVRGDSLEKSEPGIIDDVGAAWSSPEGYTFRDGARRFETHEHDPALRLGLGAAAEYALALGIDTIRQRVGGLADGLRKELSALPGVTVQDLGAEKAGLVTFTHEGVAAADITAALGEADICVKTIPRAGAFLDTLARDIPELVRVSAHYFNTEDELDTLLRTLRGVIGAG